MNKLKKIVSVAMCTAMTLSMAACGGSSSDNKTTAAGGDTTTAGATESSGIVSNTGDKTIVCSEQPENGEYDPAGATAYVYFDYSMYCLDGLIDYDEKGEIIPAAAEKWESNDDATEWTFHLKKDAKWSDGSAVTSADFLNTITRALDPDKGSWYVDSLFIIKGTEDAFNGKAKIKDIGVECPDDYTIKFILSNACANFLDYLKLPVYMPSNCKYATKEDEDWDTDVKKNLGNGPYTMGEYKAGDYITFVPNTYYDKASDVKLKKITYKFMDDSQAMTSAYQTGEVDVVSGAPYYVEDQYAGKSDLQTSPVLVTNYLLFNISEKPFDDVKVRQALSLAVDRTKLTTVIGSNYEPASTFVAANFKSKVDGAAWKDVQGAMLEENVEKAKQLLADAGYPDGQGLPKLTYTYPSMSYEADVAQALQAQWKENLGIDVELNAMEYEVYVDSRRKGELQFCRMQWTGDYNDPATWLDMYKTGNSQNDVKWSNADYDKSMSDASSELDNAKRQELLTKAEKILVTDDTIICPLFTTNSYYLVNSSISGIKQYAMGGLDFRYADKN